MNFAPDFSVRIPADSRLAGLRISAPFTIPSGVVTTVPTVIARIAREIPAVGFLTTKTISVTPRTGYREPVLYEYHPGCFINAVGLANPGANPFFEAMRPLLPLHGAKPLFVSIMGQDPDEFLECARILAPIADAFELNLSCPHVKGAGQSIGSDPEMVRRAIGMLREALPQPVIPKLSPNLTDLVGMARVCVEAGADAIGLINTVGPGMATDPEGNPVLSNVVGGVSGAAILPIGLKAVREVAATVAAPIIASGGIASAEDVLAYYKAGATFFAVGSALAGMTTPEIVEFFDRLVADLSQPEGGKAGPQRCQGSSRTTYLRVRVLENRPVGGSMFRLRLSRGPAADPGAFFFLRIPGIGEKPFSPAAAPDHDYLIRAVGPFTAALEQLRPGDPVFVRGPYGRGFPEPSPDRPCVLVGGGTGSAPLMMAARRWPNRITQGFFGFSQQIDAELRTELEQLTPDSHVVVDEPGRIGSVVAALERSLRDEPTVYQDCVAYVCGPAVMMDAVVRSLGMVIPRDRIFVGREDVMRCGIGLCGSCGTEAGLRSCVDGPVVRANEG